MKNKIDQANQEGFRRLDSAQISLVDIKYAREVLPGLSDYVIGHAGPPVAWDNMCGPLQGAVIAAIKLKVGLIMMGMPGPWWSRAGSSLSPTTVWAR